MHTCILSLKQFRMPYPLKKRMEIVLQWFSRVSDWPRVIIHGAMCSYKSNTTKINHKSNVLCCAALKTILVRKQIGKLGFLIQSAINDATLIERFVDILSSGLVLFFNLNGSFLLFILKNFVVLFRAWTRVKVSSDIIYYLRRLYFRLTHTHRTWTETEAIKN